MSEDIERLIENEKEWRMYLVKKVDKLEQDLHIFKIKSYGFIAGLTAVFTGAVELIKHIGKQ